MAENTFDTGLGFDFNQSYVSSRTSDKARIDSPERDRVIRSVSKISDVDLEMLYDLMNIVKETGDVRPLANRLKDLGDKYNEGFDGIFPFNTGDFRILNENNQTFKLLEFHVGARRRARTAARTLNSHTEQMNEKLRSGDIVYATNSTPCKEYDISKSPYERFKKIWEESKGNLTNVVDNKGSLNVDLSFLPEGTRQRAEEYLLGSLRPPSLWESGIFDREPLQDGAQVPIDLGTINRAPDSIEYQNARTFQERKKIAYDLLEPVFTPRLIEDALQNVTDKDFNPLNEKLDPTNDADKIKKLDPEYQALIAQYLLDVSMGDVQNFTQQFNDFTKMTKSEQLEFVKSGGFFGSDAKKNAVIGFVGVLTALELIKQPVDLLGEAGIDLPKVIGNSHRLAVYQGYLEILLGAYKSMYYFMKGDVAGGVKQSAITLVSAMCEFGWPALIQQGATKIIGRNVLQELVASGLGGYVGLSITTMTTYWDLVVKPKYQYRQLALGNELLDLERREIEDKCCKQINAELYRKTGGQLSILMTDSGYIPIGREYRRTIQGPGESLNAVTREDGKKLPVQDGPCESNGQIPVSIEKRFIKYKQSYDPNDLSDVAGYETETPIYIVDPREEKDPCEKQKRIKELREKAIIVRPTGEGDIGQIDYKEDVSSGSPVIWSENEEKQLEVASLQYNRQYISDVYKSKIDTAKCKTGEIPNPSEYGGGGAPDRDGFYGVGESGMTAGFHRIGSAIIARQIFETRTLDNPLDTISRRSSFWNGEWEVTTREYGFNVGGGGDGSGKLRGIVGFGYDPLRPPKPIRQV